MGIQNSDKPNTGEGKNAATLYTLSGHFFNEWRGAKAPCEIAYTLNTSSKTGMNFGVIVSQPTNISQEQTGDFVEGLWNSDVAELFLFSPLTSTYQEFNFAPSGAWWSCVFNDYRQRADLQPLVPQPHIKKTSTKTSWSVEVTIPRESVLVAERLQESLCVNIAVILGGDNFYSLNADQRREPDFHWRGPGCPRLRW